MRTKKGTKNATKAVPTKCGPKRGHMSGQFCLTLCHLFFNAFSGVAFWAAFLATRFLEGWKGCSPQPPAKEP